MRTGCRVAVNRVLRLGFELSVPSRPVGFGTGLGPTLVFECGVGAGLPVFWVGGVPAAVRGSAASLRLLERLRDRDDVPALLRRAALSLLARRAAVFLVAGAAPLLVLETAALLVVVGREVEEVRRPPAAFGRAPARVVRLVLALLRALFPFAAAL